MLQSIRRLARIFFQYCHKQKNCSTIFQNHVELTLPVAGGAKLILANSAGTFGFPLSHSLEFYRTISNRCGLVSPFALMNSARPR